VLTSQSRTNNTSLILTESKISETYIVTETGKTNNGRLSVPTQTNEKTVGLQDVILRSCASSINSSGSRRTSQADSNCKDIFFLYTIKKFVISYIISNCIFSIIQFPVGSTCGDSGVPLTLPGSPKRDTLESRHKELLKTQKHLQEQYDRLQRIHGTQVTTASAESDVQVVGPPSPHCTSQMVNEASVTSERQLNAQKTTETCDLVTSEKKNVQNIENQEIAVEITRNVNQPTDHSAERKEQLPNPSTIDADRDKGRDYTFISLLLDNAHETDIL
jgi:hypothetical protein